MEWLRHRCFFNEKSRTGESFIQLGALKVKKVLIVDDQLVMRKLMQSFLGSLDPTLQIDQAAHPGDALQKTETIHYDLIFTDLVMPDMHGNELIRAIRAQSLNKASKICVISGTESEQELSDSKAAGANAFILKPIKKAVLSLALEKLLL